jgi:hypothetical protein
MGSQDEKTTDSSNRTWLGDRYFTGGARLSRPDRYIRGTFDQHLYRNAREGDFRYDIPLKSGTYELHLLFCELLYGGENADSTGEGTRRFRVSVNGRVLLPSFDILSDAGSENTADEKRFTGISPGADGRLHLEFASLAGNAALSGIEVLPASSAKLRPVRILAGGYGVRADKLHQWWSSDGYFLGGRALQDQKPLAASIGAGLLQSERYGNFRYAIPVVEGRYSVSLYFADTKSRPGSLGFGNSLGGVLQDGLFDVFCNGVALLNNLDVVEESGGPNRVLVKTLHGLTPNSQNKILLSFVPVNDYASLRAVEVVQQ